MSSPTSWERYQSHPLVGPRRVALERHEQCKVHVPPYRQSHVMMRGLWGRSHRLSSFGDGAYRHADSAPSWYGPKVSKISNHR